MTSQNSSDRRRGKPQIYTYSNLCDATPNSLVNVFAVVKFIKKPYKTKGSDYCQVLSIVDGTYHGHNKLKCVFFLRRESDFPPLRVGCIARFHRLKIITHGDEIQGNNGAGFSWVLFDPDVNGPDEPFAMSSANATITDEDMKRLAKIRQWLATTSGSFCQSTNPKRLCDAESGDYMDTICQVVGRSLIPKESCVILRVWDGTRPSKAVRKADEMKDVELEVVDENLAKVADTFLYDVFIFDDHYTSAENMQPGDMVKFTNLHTAPCKIKPTSATDGGNPPVELVIHRGRSYGRGIEKIPDTSSEAVEVAERLAKIKRLKQTYEAEVTVQSDETESQPNGGPCQSSSIARVPLEQMTRLADPKKSSPNMYDYSLFSDFLERFACPVSESQRSLLKTQTVIIGHHNVTTSTLSEVLDHPAPYKFRVQCYLLDYFPRNLDSIRVFCPHCLYLSERGADYLCTEKCPRCRGDQLMSQEPSASDLTTSGRRNLTIAMKLVLIDKTGWLEATLWGHEAVKFFGGELVDASTFPRKLAALDSARLENEKTRDDCLLECCLRSYSVNGKINYQIFDTKLVRDS